MTNFAVESFDVSRFRMIHFSTSLILTTTVVAVEYWNYVFSFWIYRKKSFHGPGNMSNSVLFKVLLYIWESFIVVN